MQFWVHIIGHEFVVCRRWRWATGSSVQTERVEDRVVRTSKDRDYVDTVLSSLCTKGFPCWRIGSANMHHLMTVEKIALSLGDI